MVKRSAGNLPAELTSFVGRRRELAAARKLLSAARLLTLTGPGGVGKSRLAARTAQDTRRGFRDGVWLVELAPVTEGELVPEAIGHALGLRDNTDDPAGRLADFLADKQLLILLDNCEHLVEHCRAVIAKLLAYAPDVRILATSRHVLGVEGEHILPVAPLPVGDTADGDRDAVELFTHRAVAARPDFDPDDETTRAVVSRICRRLDGMPLALELAASRVRALSVQEIDDHLDDALSLLTGGPRTGTDRRRTLRATIEWSYRLSAPGERSLWERVSVFPGEFGLDAAEAVCAGDGIDQEYVLDLLAGLVDKSVVMRQTGAVGVRTRFRLLDVVRQFGLERLAAAGAETALRKRHRDHFLALSERFDAEFSSPRGENALQQLRRHHLDLRSALEFSFAEPEQVATGLRLATALRSYWRYAGYVREGHRWLSTALRLNPEPTLDRAHALVTCSHLAHLMNDDESARRLLDECEALGDRFGDRGVHAAVLHRRAALVAVGEDDIAGAVELLNDALSEYRALGDRANVAHVLSLMAIFSLYVRDSRATTLCRESLALTEELGSIREKAYCTYVSGLLAWHADKHRKAARLLGACLRMFQRIDDEIGIVVGLTGLALVANATGEPERAARLLGAAHEASRRSGTTPVSQGHTPGSTVYVVSRVHQRYLGDEAEGQIKRSLRDEDFGRAFSDGSSLTTEEAVDYALRPDQTKKASTKDTHHRSVLTRRERQIAHLVAEGLTNRDIAARLVISQRTAEAHVEHILTKLGFRSRTQIAGWITDSDRADQRDQTLRPSGLP